MRPRLALFAALVMVFELAFGAQASAGGRDWAALAAAIGNKPQLFERLSPDDQQAVLNFVRAGKVYVSLTKTPAAPPAVQQAASVDPSGDSVNSGWLCGDYTARIWKQNGYGNTEWTVWERIWWYCDGTLVTAHGPSWGGSADFGWYYQGVVAQSETGGDGQFYYRMWTKHKTCWSCGLWYEDVDYPAIEIVVYGDGSYTWSTSCDMC